MSEVHLKLKEDEEVNNEEKVQEDEEKVQEDEEKNIEVEKRDHNTETEKKSSKKDHVILGIFGNDCCRPEEEKDDEDEEKEISSLSQFQTKGFRVVVLWVTLLILLGISLTATIATSKTVKGSLNINNPWTINLDNCNLQIVASSIVSSPKVSVQIPSFQSSISVSITSSSLTVQNNIDITHKYQSYFCNVQIDIPSSLQNSPLPPIQINALGSRLTTVVSAGFTWSNLTIGGGEYILTNFVNSKFTNLSVNGFGTFRAQGCTITGNSTFNFNGNVWFDLQNSVNVELTNVSTSYQCLNAIQVSGPENCSSNPNATICQAYSLLASFGETPSNTIQIFCPSECNFHAIVRQDPNNQSLQTVPQSNIGQAIGLSNFDKTRLQQIVTQSYPNRERIDIDIYGPGVPFGRYVWASRMLYLIYEPAYLNVFTVTLLSPYKSSINLTLTPTFCPGLNTSLNVQNLVQVQNLIQSVINPPSNPASIYAFVEYSEYLGAAVGNSYQLERDDVSGDYFLVYLGFSTEPRLLIILLANIILTVLTVAYGFYFLIHYYLKWKADTIPEWGEDYYGARWEEKKETVLHQAGVYFMAEFLVGFPKENASWTNSILVVLLHIFLIVLTVIPLLVVCGLWSYSIGYSNGWIITGYIISAIYVALEAIDLTLYYLHLPWREYRILNYPVAFIFFIVFGISFLYVTNLTYWLIMGALIDPNTVLPYASVAVVFFIHTIQVFVRVSNLITRLNQGITQFKSGTQEHSNATVSTNLSLTQGMAILEKSELLKIRDVTVRQMIVIEVWVYFILLFFFIFVLIGFTTLSNTQNISSAISSLLVILVGGGINVPLSQLSGENLKTKWEQRLTEEAQKKKKKNL